MLNPSINRLATTRVTRLSTVLAAIVITLSLAAVNSYPQGKGTALEPIQDENAAVQPLLAQQQGLPAPAPAAVPQPTQQARRPAPATPTQNTQDGTAQERVDQSATTQAPQPAPRDDYEEMRARYEALLNQSKQQAATQRYLEELQKNLTAPEDLRRQLEDVQRALKLQEAARALEQRPTEAQLRQVQADILSMRTEMERSLQETRRMLDELNRRLDSLQRSQQ